ncbi:MAG: hypothetical protein M1822_008110 [Bathelium mastoideum]|nr:MAG: hypothetical protein M1822_008110 [Bathelium mastoideum]
MPFMRPLRLLLSLLSCVVAITILLYATLRASAPNGSTSSKSKTAIHSLFSFHTPSSLFPPSAIISLTDDNSTFFLARPAAFGPTLPSGGLSGQLWIGSGFGDDSLNRGGIVTGAEGELGCSDIPGWTGPDQKGTIDAEPSSRFTWAKKTAENAAGYDAVSASISRAETLARDDVVLEERAESLSAKNDGTDDHLHHSVSDMRVTSPSDLGRKKGGRAPAHADIQSLQEGAEIAGKVVLLSRGGCGFLEKVKWVQRRGGTALIVGDDVRGGPLVTMYARGDTSNITIPALFTSRMTAHLIAGLIPSGSYLDGIPIGEDVMLPGKTGAYKRVGKGRKSTSTSAAEGDVTRPTSSTTSAISTPTAKSTKAIRSIPQSSQPGHTKPSSHVAKQAGFVQSMISALGLLSGAGSAQRQDSRRPPSSGQVDWVLEEWKEAEVTFTTTSKSTYVTTSTSKAKALATTSTSSLPGHGSKNSDFVIGVHDWRDPDLVGVDVGAEGFQSSTQSSKSRAASTRSASTYAVSHFKGGSITPGSGEYDLRDDGLGNSDVPEKASHAVFSSNGAVPQKAPTDEQTGNWPHPWSLGENVADHHNAIHAQNTKSTRPHPASLNALSPSPSRLLDTEVRDGLWVTLTPTSMSSSPFFDTLLVLVVSPLVTLTIVYALLLLRSRIRRRRWRAPKSVVERLPVRTYQTLPSSSTSSGSPIATPITATSTTPLLQTGRPRTRTAGSAPTPTLTRALTIEENHDEQEDPGEGSYAQQEKHDAGLAEWRRKYGGKQKECVVCLEEYIDGVSRVMSLPCGHEFHQGCM